MRTLKSIFVVLLLLCSKFSFTQVLAGEVVVGNEIGDISFSELQSRLNNDGINGPIHVRIRYGYDLSNSRLNIDNVATSVQDTILISSFDGDPNLVVFDASASSSSLNYLIKINATNYVTLRDLGFSPSGSNYNTAILIEGGSSNIRIESNKLTGNNPGSENSEFSLIYSSSSSSENNITIVDNKITDGGWGIKMFGVSALNPDLGTKINGNNIENCSGGIYLENNRNGEIKSNEILNNLSAPTGKGMCLDIDQMFDVSSNLVLSNGAAAFRLKYHNSVNLSGDALIINNRFIASNYYSAKLESSKDVKFYHNTVVGNSSFQPLYINDLDSSSIMNNIFDNQVAGYAAVVYSIGSKTTFASNAYRFTANVGFIDGYTKTFDEWKSDLSTINSISGAPELTSITELKLKCTPNIAFKTNNLLSEVQTDFEGQTRDNGVWVGADEFFDTDFNTSISGYVKNGVDTIKDGELLLLADTSGNTALDKIQQISINSSGYYLFNDVPVLDYIIYIKPNATNYSEFLNSYHDSVINWQESSFFKPGGCSNLALDIHPKKLEDFNETGSLKIAGVITNDESAKTTNPIPGLDVVLDKIPPGYSIRKTKTDENGEYKFENLPKGKYKVSIDFPGVRTDSLYVVELDNKDLGYLNYCVDTTSHVDLCVGTDPNSINEVERSNSIYPNPSNGILNVPFTDKLGQIILIDFTGKIVLNEMLNTGLNTFNLEDKSKGVYFARIINDEGSFEVTKILIK